MLCQHQSSDLPKTGDWETILFFLQFELFQSNNVTCLPISCTKHNAVRAFFNAIQLFIVIHMTAAVQSRHNRLWRRRNDTSHGRDRRRRNLCWWWCLYFRVWRMIFRMTWLCLCIRVWLASFLRRSRSFGITIIGFPFGFSSSNWCWAHKALFEVLAFLALAKGGFNFGSDVWRLVQTHFSHIDSMQLSKWVPKGKYRWIKYSHYNPIVYFASYSIASWS